MPAIFTGTGLFTVLIIASDMSEKMKALALMDSLTGALNLRGFHDAAHRLLATARRNNSPLCIITSDVDHFKVVNDLHGHATGDDVLRQFSAHLQAQARTSDVVARIGGEEFVVLLPDTNLDATSAAAERLRASLSELAIRSDNISVTVQASFGVASLNGKGDTIAELMRRADAALYQSKRNGRNQVTVA